MRVDLEGILREEIEQLVVALEAVGDIPYCKILRITARDSSGAVVSDNLRIEVRAARPGVVLPILGHQSNVQSAVDGVKFFEDLYRRRDQSNAN